MLFLTEKGFKNIILLAGGIVDRESSGLPVIKILQNNYMVSVLL